MREVAVGCKAKTNESCEAKFEDFQDDLFQFLARRFGSLALAERIKQEMSKRIAEADMLALVGNPKVYLNSYGVSLGLQYLQEELGVSPHHKEMY